MESKQARRNLWIYVFAIAVSRFGSQFMFLAVTSYTYMITGSALATSVQMVATGLPTILLARWSGKAADRFDPRRVITGVCIIQAVLTLGYLRADSTGAILALNFLVSSVGVFLAPARASLLPQMVGRGNLLKANARMASVGGAVQLVAPALAGFLLVRFGPERAFLTNSLSYLFPAMAMFLIKLVEPTSDPQAKRRSVVPFGLAEAWAFFRERRELVFILGAYGAYALGMWSVNAIFYPYAVEVLKGDARVVGWSISAYFGAATVTGFVLERWGGILRSRMLLVSGYLIGAAVWAGYALTTSIPVAIILSAFDGLIFTCAVTLFETRIQEEAPAHARGRLFALVRAYDELCVASGGLAGGALATYRGIVPGIAMSAAFSAILVSGLAAFGRTGGRAEADVGAQAD